MRVLVATLVLALATVTNIRSRSAEAQSWPQRTVRLVLPFGAGSSTDVMARLLSDRLQSTWGHPVLLESPTSWSSRSKIRVSCGAFA